MLRRLTTILALTSMLAGFTATAFGQSENTDAGITSAASQKAAQSLTSDWTKRIVSLEKRQRASGLKKRSLRRAYEVELSKIDTLKSQRRSWRRDGELKKLKASSEQLAKQLSRIDKQMTADAIEMKKAKSNLSASIKKEQRSGTTEARNTQLRKIVKRFSLQKKGKSRKKIILPKTEIDALADPTELKIQMALLAQTEKKLLAEERILIAKANVYKRSRRLERQRSRSRQLSLLDDDRVSRGLGGTNARGPLEQAEGNGAQDDSSGEAPSAPQSDFDESDPLAGTENEPSPPSNDVFQSTLFSLGSLDESSIILAEVVDSGTKNKLKSASQSKNPRDKEKAARLAQKNVEKKRKELMRLRMQIAKRLRTIGE